MKKSLDPLSSLKRAERLRVVEVLQASFAEAMATKRPDRLMLKRRIFAFSHEQVIGAHPDDLISLAEGTDAALRR